MPSSVVQCLSSAVNTNSTKQTRHMDFDGVFADVKGFGDFVVCQALIEQQNELFLSLSQLYLCSSTGDVIRI